MPREAATDRIALRHFFVTPGVAAAHALSGLAIFAGAASVLKTTPLYLLGSIVPNPQWLLVSSLQPLLSQ
jgi:hypothetical protein